MIIADTLSRAYLPEDNNGSKKFHEINMFSFLPIRDERLEAIRLETEKDDNLQALKKVILAGWPEERKELPEQLVPFYSYRDELAVQDGLIFKSNRVVIPKALRAEMVQKIHTSHLGIDLKAILATHVTRYKTIHLIIPAQQNTSACNNGVTSNTRIQESDRDG